MAEFREVRKTPTKRKAFYNSSESSQNDEIQTTPMKKRTLSSNLSSSYSQSEASEMVRSPLKEMQSELNISPIIKRTPVKRGKTHLFASTPQSDSSTVSLNSVSSFTNEEDSPIVKRRARVSLFNSESSISGNRSIVTSSPASLLEALNDMDLSTNENEDFESDIIKGFKLEGRDYEIFKPKFQKNLYGRIMKDYNELEYLAHGWVILYRSDQTIAIQYLIQLVIDVMGYQNYRLELKPHKSHYAQILIDLEENPTKQHQDSIFILNCHSSWGCKFNQIFFKFLNLLIKQCHDSKILYQDVIYNSFFTFLNILSKSAQRHIRFTSVLIAVKLMTSIVKILKNITSDPTKLPDDSEKTILFKTIDLINDIYCKNSIIRDEKMYNLHRMCLEELTVWLNVFPQNFTKVYIKSIATSIEHMDPQVRCAALKCSNALLELRTNPQIMKKIVTRTINRFEDVSHKVCIMSIKFFSTMAKINLSDAPDSVNELVVRHGLFSKHYLVAKASAEYVNIFLNLLHDTEENSKVLILTSILKIIKREHEGEISHLVESFLDSTPEIKDIHFLLQMLYDGGIADHLQNYLVIFIYCVVYQLINGSCKIRRIGYRKGSNLDANNKKIGNILIQFMPTLIQKFTESPLKLQYLTKMLLVIDYNEISFNTHRGEMIETIALLIIIYNNSRHQDLNTCICSYFDYLIRSPFKKYCSEALNRYIDALAKAYDNIVSHMHRGSTNVAAIANLEKHLFLLSILFKKQTTIDRIEWYAIFEDWQRSLLTEKCITYQISCCGSFLLWQVRSLLNRNVDVLDVDEINEFMSLYRQFIEACSELLKHNDSHKLRAEAFGAICNVSEEIRLEIDPFISKAEYKDFTVQPFGEDIDVALKNFVIQQCFETNLDTLKARRGYLIGFSNMSFRMFVAPKNIREILKYCHQYKDDYKIVFNGIISSLQDVNEEVVSAFLLGTLQEVYNDLPSTCSENKNLTNLANEFNSCVNSNTSLTILKTGIDLVASNETRIPFLIYLRAFTVKLNLDQRIEMLKYTKQSLPTNWNQHDTVIHFRTCLKSKIQKRGLLKKVIDTSSESPNISIEAETTTVDNQEIVENLTDSQELTIEDVDSP